MQWAVLLNKFRNYQLSSSSGQPVCCITAEQKQRSKQWLLFLTQDRLKLNLVSKLTACQHGPNLQVSYLSSIATVDFMRTDLPLQSAAELPYECIPCSLINCQYKLRWEKIRLKSQKRVAHDRSSSWLQGRGWRAFLLSASYKACLCGKQNKTLLLDFFRTNSDPIDFCLFAFRF